MQAFNGYCAYQMRVEGSGSLKVLPDTATVSAGVTTENPQLKAAQEQNAAAVGNIIRSLEGLGIPPEQIQTQSYAIDPQYDYIDGRQVFKSYRVAQLLTITLTKPDRIGEVLDLAVASGANTVGGISFFVQDPTKYYQLALSAAIDDASLKARTIAGRLNVRLFETPVRLTEENYQYSSPLQPKMLAASAAATPVPIGQIEITARIEAVFAYIQ